MADPTYANGFWNFTICDVFTGERILRVPASEARWGRRISDVPNGQHTLALRGQGIAKETLKRILLPNSTYVVQSWQAEPFYPDTPVYAGLVKQSVHDRDAGTLEVPSYDVRSILAKRHMVKVGSYAADEAWSVAGQSVQGLVREVVAAGTWAPGVVNYTLPFVWPSQPAGSESLSFPNWQFTTVEDALHALEARADGPDVEFEPRWNVDTHRLEFLLRIGSPRFHDAGEADFPMNVDAPPFTKIRSTLDGSEVVTHGFAIGSGSDEDTPVREAGVYGSDVPMMQATVKSDSTDGDVLQDAIQSEIEARREPTEQWAMNALASQFPVITNWRLGTTLRLFFKNDEWEDDGWKELYLVGITGDHTETITLEVQVLENL